MNSNQSESIVADSRYKITRLLAKGSYGNVYLATHALDGAECCIKRVQLDGLSPTEIDDSLNEVRVLRATNHPNIIGYIDSFISATTLNIVTQLAINGDLGSLIAQHRQASMQIQEKRIWNVTSQICFGLEYLHSMRILHRDLKPQNIFMDDYNSIKIGDLGFGRVLNRHESFASSSVGTPIYLSPELCNGEPYDGRADIWALGCVVHELSALQPPFNGTSHVGLAFNILRCSPGFIPSCYSSELQSFIHYLLQKQQDKRPNIKQVLGLPGMVTAFGLHIEAPEPFSRCTDSATHQTDCGSRVEDDIRILNSPQLQSSDTPMIEKVSLVSLPLSTAGETYTPKKLLETQMHQFTTPQNNVNVEELSKTKVVRGSPRKKLIPILKCDRDSDMTLLSLGSRDSTNTNQLVSKRKLEFHVHPNPTLGPPLRIPKSPQRKQNIRSSPRAEHRSMSRKSAFIS